MTQGGGLPPNDADIRIDTGSKVPTFSIWAHRGALTGKASGLQPGFPAVIGLNNNDYQFWVSADDYGTFTAKHIPSGTYEMALYQQEFAAATTTVSIKPGGATATQNIQATSTVIATKRNTIFQLGEYDGQPFEFLNGD
ncbi:hypothetical protein BDV41DRAFT_576116 [Aspergillus transmontanensis]|uniref:Rhamnogalacturonan lyase domain-containing protein n=1 Tax=Aspergillus transmontanensis TaxID=1034304 RepID=A0A5N6W0E7_9EURO|nr:hypothetical protein BDV41DRAFT_576116 [Aspergillus transmontanensis]